MTGQHAAGQIIRVGIDFTEQFTRIPNAWVRDPRLTYRARGILAALLSHGKGARVSLEGLVDQTAKRNASSRAHEGRDAVRAAVAELESCGYLARPKRRTQGRYVVDWVLKAPHAQLPGMGHRVGSADPVESHRVGSAASAQPTDKKTKPEDNPRPSETTHGVGSSDAVHVDNSPCWNKYSDAYVHARPMGAVSGGMSECTRCGELFEVLPPVRLLPTEAGA